VYFNWRDDGRAGVGVIAQEMEKVLPQVVKKTPAGDRTVEYGGITGVLIEAIKELSTELDSANSKILDLETRLLILGSRSDSSTKP
jgi:hypothetical protein